MKRVWIYIGAIDFLALMVLYFCFSNPAPFLLFQALIVAVLITAAELYPLDIFDEGDLTLTGLIKTVTLLTLGFAPTVIGDLIGVALYGFIKRRPVIKTLFNIGQSCLSTAAAYFVFIQIGGIPNTLTVHAFALPLISVIVNTSLIGFLLSLLHNLSVWQVWVMLNRETLPYTISIYVGGLVSAGLILAFSWVGVILFAILAISLWRVLYQAGYSISSMKNRYKETIAVLTTALEFRDPYTHGHSQRVANWCRKIAEEMHLYPAEVDKIELGGLMHDVGKVGVPDHILKKPGQLTKEEYAEVKNHTVIGERILSELKGMDYVAAMARQHHLFYNGDPKGYPDTLPGSEALLGSRILGVADAWDAMTGDRPYRRSLTIPEAVEELRVNSGIQFDPEVVAAFINVLKAEGVYSEESPVKDKKPCHKNENEKAGVTAC